MYNIQNVYIRIVVNISNNDEDKLSDISEHFSR